MRQHPRWVYDVPDLGAVVRRVRAERGLSQASLAERLGVGRMTVSRLESGEPVSTDTALRALSECGYAVAVVPKFSRITLGDTPDPADPADG